MAAVIPPWLTRLVDDAAIFPPGNVPLDRAVAEHRTHRASEYADLVGGFVISDVKVPDLIDVLDDASEDDPEPLAVNLVVTGGAGAIEPAVRWATGTPLLRLEAVECLLRDEDDLARNAQRVCAVIDTIAGDLGDAQVYVEPPRLDGDPGPGWLGALDEVAARDLRLKFRTGGTTADDPEAACVPHGVDTSASDAGRRHPAFPCRAPARDSHWPRRRARGPARLAERPRDLGERQAEPHRRALGRGRHPRHDLPAHRLRRAW